MNKIFITLLVFFSSAISPLFCNWNSSIQVRSAVFFHNSEHFRNVYGTCSGCYELEAATQLTRCVDGWCNFDWFSKRGKSTGFSHPTRVNIANVSWGLKFPYRFNEYFEGYLGIGPSFSRTWITNKWHGNRDRRTKFVVGGILKSGVCCNITKETFVDVFFDYLYQPATYKRYVDIGGIKVGVGLGYRF